MWMMENAVYSVLSPEGYASILWKDSSKVEQAAEKMKLTAKDLKEKGIIDKIILEPEEGITRTNLQETVKGMKEEILKEIKKLQKLSPEELRNNRYEKFRSMGEYIEIK